MNLEPPAFPPVDYLIVGGGLAGMVLARVLRARGKTVRVVDWPNPAAASRVAAGILNPITGRNLVPSRNWDRYMAEAESFYLDWERETGTRFFFRLPVHRFFANRQEREIREAKRHDPVFARHAREMPAAAASAPGLRSGLEGFAIEGGGCVDTRELLRVGAEALRNNGMLREEKIDYGDIVLETGGVRWRDLVASKVVFCEGWRAGGNPWFSWIPFRHAKGEILTFARDDRFSGAILNRRKWIAPFPGEHRAGATYDWNDFSETPTAAGRTEIEKGLRTFLREIPEVTGHFAGIRPIVIDSLPLAGIHPAHPQLAIFNGFGSKGVLWAPRLARQLADCLENNGEIDADADIRRNL